ncbi:hypothetical protein GCM10011392_20390 [Wenxinia marina]|nr:hypothetical protein GCM10011392_20390 [Wenxinia marina]
MGREPGDWFQTAYDAGARRSDAASTASADPRRTFRFRRGYKFHSECNPRVQEALGQTKMLRPQALNVPSAVGKIGNNPSRGE